jgi:monoamine oxidase
MRGTKRLHPIAASAWARDPHAQGSYSHAKPGRADARQVLAAPVDRRLFFAGEACSSEDFSTAHGAYRSGVGAAEQVIAALGP